MMSKEIFNPDNGLFKLSADGTSFQPNPQSYINPDHLSYFEFVGRVIGMSVYVVSSVSLNTYYTILGMAIYHGEILEVGFTRSFYKHILGIPLTLRDLETVDHEYYKYVSLTTTIFLLTISSKKSFMDPRKRYHSR